VSQELLYVMMTGLNATMDDMTATTNNLANTSTTAFKAQKPAFKALPLYGQGLPDRVDVAAAEQSANLAQGPVQQTGRSLDVAVKGTGWIAVQAADGSPALTRNGALSISSTGVLETSDGRPVLGQSGEPITLPPLQNVSIGDDGTISGVPLGQEPNQIAALNRILLANPPAPSISRRTDGLFQSSTGAATTSDAAVHLQVGALEGSNTNPVGLMVDMIQNTRMFQMQTELMHSMGSMQQGQNTPLSIT
jgi:flagellar basal-body rod protein FlgF